KLFNDRVAIALTNVANEILTINNDPAELFQSVKQIRPNYFTVAINDTVHPYLLEGLLRSEFEKRNIAQNFEYGVYDCFTDSIVFGNYIALNDDTTGTNYLGEAQKIKWDKDGHYFGVYFPHRESLPILPPRQNQVSTWAFSAIISLIVFGFFAFAIYVIIRQKRLSEMKTDFINNMTHELKTPISTISLSSEVLLGDAISSNPDRLKKYAQLIYNENQRLRMQVDKVLQLATLEKEQVELKKEPIDIHAVIRSATESINLVYSESQIQIELFLQAKNHTLSGDPVHIANIIHNLLDNAIKYSPDKPHIVFRTTNKNKSIVISIQDSGIGISKKSIPYIFDKFYRVPTGNRHDVKGFGLGLYYVHQLTKAHKGSIKVSSEPGVGSTFHLEFPTFSK
ncbi:MAG: sensor histidine kinase, partial [Cryomorphaceae bacterium]